MPRESDTSSFRYLFFFSVVDIISYSFDLYSDTLNWISSRKGGTISDFSSSSDDGSRNLSNNNPVLNVFGTLNSSFQNNKCSEYERGPYLSTYLWHRACLAVSRFVGSITSSALIKSLASLGASTNSSSMLGLELIDLVGWFKSVEPKPFPTDFKSLSLGAGKADKIHSICQKQRKNCSVKKPPENRLILKIY